MNHLVDANFILRFLLRDNIKQYEQASKFFESKVNSRSKIKITSEVVMEVEYVLRKFYKVPRVVISRQLVELIKNDCLEVEKRDLLLISFKKYSSNRIDLVDILLYFQAKRENAEILSFDKDFKKLAK